MPNYRRPALPGASVFFTVNLEVRGSRLLVEEVDRLRGAVRDVRSARPFGIDAWVVLPDHLHCVWTLPEDDADYAARWAAIKARFSRGLPAGRRRASHVRRREKGVWQRRYHERHLRDEEGYRAALRYCWENPIRHGFAERAEDWPWSSVHRAMREGIYVP